MRSTSMQGTIRQLIDRLPFPRRPAQSPGSRQIADRRECARILECDLRLEQTGSRDCAKRSLCEGSAISCRANLFSDILEGEEDQVDFIGRIRVIDRIGLERYISSNPARPTAIAAPC